MKRVILEVASNRPLTPLVYEMQLTGDTSAVTRPGGFVEISLDGLFLRRPISVCDFHEGR
jgi:dihydroorotate dehydrogenase electron transfer subunit